MTNAASNAVQRAVIRIEMHWRAEFFHPFQAEAPAGGEADLIDVGFTDDVKKGGHGGGGGGGFTAPLVGHDGIVPMPVMMPMPMPTPNPPFSYPPPKGPVSAFALRIPFFCGRLIVMLSPVPADWEVSVPDSLMCQKAIVLL